MIDIILFFIFISLFGGRGILLFILYLLLKTAIPKIKVYWKEKDKLDRIIDLNNIKNSHKFQFFNTSTMLRPSIKTFVSGIIILLIVLIVIDGFTSIPAGHIGVIYDRGRGVLSEELPEGLHLKIPVWQIVEKMDVRTTEYTMSVTPGEGNRYDDDSMTAPTSDGQTVSIDATVLFHIDKEKASDLYQTVGTDYIQKIVRPTVRGQIRMVISRYTAIDIYSEKRAEAEGKMTEEIKTILAEKGITLERVLLRNISFSPEYAKAIEEKQIAQQKIQKAEYQRQEAEKLKEKKIIEAEADAEAIRLKGETLRVNPEVIQFEFVQKMADDINWGVLPDKILPLLNLGER